jgi:hypothetical protein
MGNRILFSIAIKEDVRNTSTFSAHAKKLTETIE